MNSENTTPINLIDMNEAHRQLITDQIEQMETRVEDLERSLVHHATGMYDVVTRKLDLLFTNEAFVEFESLPDGIGVIKVNESDDAANTTGTSREVADTIKMARQQLEMLNQTIEEIELSR